MKAFSQKILFYSIILIALLKPHLGLAKLVVLQSDFGTRDAAVSAMKIVIHNVDEEIRIIDNTHEIEQFQIYEGAYRLYQSAPLAKEGTVYVSVVDPGVGSQRLSIVAKDKRGVLYVTPDNGTLTYIAREIGLSEVRIINETALRRPGSENSHTFHGRDIYAYVAGLLASGKITFEDIGETLDPKNIKLFPIQAAEISNDRLVLSGIVEIHDIRYGNLWTNIPEALALEFGLKVGEKYKVHIYHHGKLFRSLELPFLRSFAGAKDLADKKLIYFNSLGRIACSELLGSFAKSTGVGFGADWRIEISK
jgi:S-adenosylmethionine hydrolase